MRKPKKKVVPKEIPVEEKEKIIQELDKTICELCNLEKLFFVGKLCKECYGEISTKLYKQYLEEKRQAQERKNRP